MRFLENRTSSVFFTLIIATFIEMSIVTVIIIELIFFLPSLSLSLSLLSLVHI